MGFDKCVMTYIHHYSVIQKNVTALKISCTLLLPPFLPPPPASTFYLGKIYHFFFSRKNVFLFDFQFITQILLKIVELKNGGSHLPP